MKKIAAVSLAVVLVIALLAVAGCGGSNTSSTPSGKTTSSSGSSAEKILTESNKKMTGITSVKATGAYKGNMTDSSATSGSDAFDFAFTMNVDLSNEKSPKGLMTMKGMGEDLTIYLDNGYAYVNVPGTGWGKTPVGSSGLTATTPAEIQKFAEGAQNLRIVSETGDTYKIAFDVGPKYIEQQLKSQGSTEGLTKEMQDAVTDMADPLHEDADSPTPGLTHRYPDRVLFLVTQMAKSMKISAVFSINKSTLYLTAVTMKIGLNAEALGNMSMNMAMAFSDYNKPVTVTLPPEAANAPTLQNSAATGLPSFPGLGL